MTFDFNDFISNNGGNPKQAPRPNLAEMEVSAKSTFQTKEFAEGDQQTRVSITKDFTRSCLKKGLPPKEIEIILRAHFPISLPPDQKKSAIAKMVRELRQDIIGDFVAETVGYDPRSLSEKTGEQSGLVRCHLRPSKRRDEKRYPQKDENGNHYNRVVKMQVLSKEAKIPVASYLPCGAALRAASKARETFQTENFRALSRMDQDVLPEFFNLLAAEADAAEKAESELEQIQAATSAAFNVEFPNSGKGRKVSSVDPFALLGDMEIEFNDSAVAEDSLE